MVNALTSMPSSCNQRSSLLQPGRMLQAQLGDPLLHLPRRGHGMGPVDGWQVSEAFQAMRLVKPPALMELGARDTASAASLGGVPHRLLELEAQALANGFLFRMDARRMVFTSGPYVSGPNLPGTMLWRAHKSPRSSATAYPR